MLPTRPLGRTRIPSAVSVSVGRHSATSMPACPRTSSCDRRDRPRRRHEPVRHLAHYGNGLSELRFGSALRRLPRASYVLSTKVGRHMNPWAAGGTAGGPGFAGGVPHASVLDYSYDGTMRSLEQSLLRLGP
jgi:hypothetical protein